MSQSEVADQLNISRQAISRWENGKTCPDIENLYMLSNIYGVSLDVLVGKKDNDNIVSEGNEEKTDSNSDEHHNTFILEEVLLAAINVLSCSIPILGFIIPIGVLLWMKQKKRKYKLIIILSILCMLGTLYTTYSFLYVLLVQSENVQVIQL